ncbi:MAG TPA: class I SAM-dependent methyltransferase [Blastocatellia bacterium]|nr:class I SAM-dependent methyltransferase [Blastocatellia bacterium]
MSSATLNEWERAEVERSAAEAARNSVRNLVIGETEVLRYLNPPADSYYPLEYSYHLLGDISGKTVLEYGCGDGANTVVLARRGAKVRALDISPDLIDVARQRLAANHIEGDVEFIVGSAHDLPIADNSVDVVFGIAILHHLDLALSAREVKRVLHAGGRAIFQEPMRNSKLIKFIRGLIPYQAPDLSPFERPLTDKELLAYADGLSINRSKGFMLPTTELAYFLAPLRRRIIHTCHRLDTTIMRKFPALGFYATVRVIEMIK